MAIKNKLIVGLGNPGEYYKNNRHNVGFKIIDSINKKFGLSKQKPKFKGLLTTGNVGDQKVYAIKQFFFYFSWKNIQKNNYQGYGPSSVRQNIKIYSYKKWPIFFSKNKIKNQN